VGGGGGAFAMRGARRRIVAMLKMMTKRKMAAKTQIEAKRTIAVKMWGNSDNAGVIAKQINGDDSDDDGDDSAQWRTMGAIGYAPNRMANGAQWAHCEGQQSKIIRHFFANGAIMAGRYGGAITGRYLVGRYGGALLRGAMAGR
jgi:hypothetical protein